MNEKIKQALRFLKYFFLARHSKGHGIHSPFIFDLVTKVIFAKNNKDKYSRVIEYCKYLKKCKIYIDIEDQGAGPGIGNKTKRKISSIAFNSSTSKKYGKLLARIVDYFKPLNIIELGTSLGIGSFYLSLNLLPESRFYTIEGAKSLFTYANENCKPLKLPNVFPIYGNFDDELPKLLKKIDVIDFAYIDGNHRKYPTIRYFEWLLPKINNNSVIIFDDIYWSDEMQEAWAYIKSHPSVRVSIDLFQIGIVFFRKELSRQDYIIRF